MRQWELTAAQQRIWDAGYITGYNARQDEVDGLNDEADRYYRAAFDRGTTS